MPTPKAPTLLLLAALALGGCAGPQLLLPGHDYRYDARQSRELPPVTLRVGDTVGLVRYAGGSHLHALETAVVGETPGVVESALVRDGGGRRTVLRAVGVGETRAHYLSGVDVRRADDAAWLRGHLRERQQRLRDHASSLGHSPSFDAEHARWRHLLGLDLDAAPHDALRVHFYRGASVGSFTVTVRP